MPEDKHYTISRALVEEAIKFFESQGRTLDANPRKPGGISIRMIRRYFATREDCISSGSPRIIMKHLAAIKAGRRKHQDTGPTLFDMGVTSPADNVTRLLATTTAPDDIPTDHIAAIKRIGELEAALAIARDERDMARQERDALKAQLDAILASKPKPKPQTQTKFDPAMLQVIHQAQLADKPKSQAAPKLAAREQALMDAIMATIAKREQAAREGQPYMPTPPSSCASPEGKRGGKSLRYAGLLVDRGLAIKVDIAVRRQSLMTPDFAEYWARRDEDIPPADLIV